MKPGKPIALSDLGGLARDLAGLLRLGYPTVEAVQKVAQSQSAALRIVLQRSVAQQQKGASLAASLENEASVLPLFVRLVDSAERSEALPDGLDRTALVMDDLAERRSRCFLAALYPAVVFTTVVLILWLVCVGAGHMIAGLFASMNVNLPWPTRLLLLLANVGKHPLGLVLFFAPLSLLWMMILGRTGFRLSVYSIPLFGAWLMRQESIIYLKTMGHLVDLGTPLTQAASLACDIVSPPLRTRLLHVPSRLESGDKLSVALAAGKVLPEMAIWAIERREATESLRLLEIGDLMDRELNLTMDRGLVLFEPLIFLGVLVAIGFFIVAVFLPLYQLVGNL